MSDKPEKDDQTEAPTEKRKREAREKGNVLRSRELATALVMMSGAVYLALAGAWLAESLKNVMRVGLLGIRRGGVVFHPVRAAWALGEFVALPLGGLFLVCPVAAIAVSGVDRECVLWGRGCVVGVFFG